VKILVTVGILAGLALWFYHWNLFQMGLPLIPLFASLLLMGWAVGMITTALIMRWVNPPKRSRGEFRFSSNPFARCFIH
jgi:ABC-2 type transport system permease protein